MHTKGFIGWYRIHDSVFVALHIGYAMQVDDDGVCNEVCDKEIQAQAHNPNYDDFEDSLFVLLVFSYCKSFSTASLRLLVLPIVPYCQSLRICCASLPPAKIIWRDKAETAESVWNWCQDDLVNIPKSPLGDVRAALNPFPLPFEQRPHSSNATASCKVKERIPETEFFAQGEVAEFEPSHQELTIALRKIRVDAAAGPQPDFFSNCCYPAAVAPEPVAAQLPDSFSNCCFQAGAPVASAVPTACESRVTSAVENAQSLAGSGDAAPETDVAEWTRSRRNLSLLFSPSSSFSFRWPHSIESTGQH